MSARESEVTPDGGREGGREGDIKGLPRIINIEKKGGRKGGTEGRRAYLSSREGSAWDSYARRDDRERRRPTRR